jgi:hypothetical protein
MALPKQNLGRTNYTKRCCLVLFSTIFNISDLLVDMISVSCCLNKFSNIDRTMHCCQMSKADAGHVDFLIRTKLIGLHIIKKWTIHIL